ncbi:MAG: hypothetical protein PHW96_00630 [Candidatus Nanoarchaeia archaeon]|nr:hypothetical protein [Candidatus Nanoarchaeia archaeon]
MKESYINKPETLYLTEEDRKLWDKIIASVKDSIEDFDMRNQFDIKILRESMKV